MFVPAAANAIGFVQKEVAVAQSRFGILIDCHDDCLDVMVTPAFAGRSLPNLG
jgi:hypothetical protein